MKFCCFLVSSFLFLHSAIWSHFATAEPVQYCKYSSPDRSDEEIDFCMGSLMYHNTSTNAHDMYLTMTIRRFGGSALGWTAVGLGTMMKGSLMFIVYGDPRGEEDPIISIRTAPGHHQPTLLAKSDMASGMDLRVIRSSWLQDDSSYSQDPKDPAYVGRVSLVCYSCQLWPGTEVSALSDSQPWLWAWNAKQKFDIFSFDAHLQMHKHHAGAGGWGNFYLDMKRSISTAKYPPSLPPIRTGVATLGASDRPMLFSNSFIRMAMGPGSYFHGLVLATAFLLLFPAGVIGMRSGSPKSFSIHWMIQGCASTFLLLGIVLGLLKGHKINTVHQVAGITLGSSIGVQGFLGWWHHKRFVRLHRRTWVSHLHIWLGRAVMGTGWANIVSGLLLRGYKASSGTVAVAILFVCLEALGLSAWVVWKRGEKVGSIPKPAWTKIGEDTFALSATDEESDVDDDKDDERKALSSTKDPA